jgi:hypothetical protein
MQLQQNEHQVALPRMVHKGWAIEKISFTQTVAHAKANNFDLCCKKEERERARTTRQMDRVRAVPMAINDRFPSAFNRRKPAKTVTWHQI